MDAVLTITVAGQQGDLKEPVNFDATDGDIKQWAAEAVRNGNVPGIDAMPNVSFTDYVVERYQATENRPLTLSLRPKVPFGSLINDR